MVKRITLKKNLKKILIFNIIIVLLLMNLNLSSAMTSNYKTTKLGDVNIFYVGGNGEGNYTSIQDAINIAENGDTVYVYSDSSPYNENIIIDKAIKLIGKNPENTVIETNNQNNIIEIFSSEVEITGFTISHIGEILSGYSCIKLNSDNNNIHGNIVSNNYYGISLILSSHNTIYDNIIKDNFFSGIKLHKSHYNNLENCEVTHSINGVILSKSTYNTIKNNEIISNNRGMDLYYSSYNDVIENTINGGSEHFYGLGLFWGSPTEGYSSHNTIKKNIIINNLAGIMVQGKPGSELTNNVISENLIKDNVCGIQINAYASKNHIFQNNFINNINQQADSANNAVDYCDNNWDNGQEGNYWDDYKEQNPYANSRSQRPWIWNKAYDISGGESKDRYPLKNEWKKSKVKSITDYKLLNVFNKLVLTYFIKNL